MEFVDTHCHLQFEKYNGRDNEIVANASATGVKKLICVGTTLADSQAAVQIAAGHDNVWATTGTHPHDAAKFVSNPESVKKLKALASKPKVVAIGETGLDYYRNISPQADQQQALRQHIEVGLQLDLPFVFHIRDAWEDFWPIFDSYRGISGAVHSFSSHSGHLEEALSRGLYVGLNGIMTFTKDNSQLEAAKAIPLDRLVLETDAPFLTPAPFRGELCEPKHVAVVAEFLAELRGENLQELASTTTANAIKLFNLRSA
jgi:TatD DNase family protein